MTLNVVIKVQMLLIDKLVPVVNPGTNPGEILLIGRNVLDVVERYINNLATMILNSLYLIPKCFPLQFCLALRKVILIDKSINVVFCHYIKVVRAVYILLLLHDSFFEFARDCISEVWDVLLQPHQLISIVLLQLQRLKHFLAETLNHDASHSLHYFQNNQEGQRRREFQLCETKQSITGAHLLALVHNIGPLVLEYGRIVEHPVAIDEEEERAPFHDRQEGVVELLVHEGGQLAEECKPDLLNQMLVGQGDHAHRKENRHACSEKERNEDSV